MRDRRRYPRTEANLNVRISHPELGAHTTETRDISDGGAYVLLPPGHNFSVGTVVTVQVHDAPQGAPELKMRVMRVDDEGIGLMFLDEKEASQ